MHQFVRHLAMFAILAPLLLSPSFTGGSITAAASENSSEPNGQVMGSYSKGSLLDGASLTSHGEGFVHLFDNRDRYYGSLGLIQILVKSAAEMARRFPKGERLQIGDLSGRDGGKIARHASHQNGLDVDVVFYRKNHREQDASDGEQGFIESFVKEGKVSPNLDVKRTWEFVKLIAGTGRFGRAFVHPAIKKAFCSRARALGELDSQSDTLSRIRLLDNHDDHIHLRLTCPATSADCRSLGQEVAPAKTGC